MYWEMEGWELKESMKTKKNKMKQVVGNDNNIINYQNVSPLSLLLFKFLQKKTLESVVVNHVLVSEV
ncbi:hypothetical protein, unlikely [Trypanosoma brucei brucei TREU927]|uniref:Uncharacterized protein n=1 Tax=Trypanosoma brucei brucei (strain 927/4 GUTat10.1) TaxID=185431 RepID=Q4GYH9_TRYB2|nr:hypothetical protein, unlikely [Trypanosoma brucei brucei TREU927]CAJ16605.1 hypothetical protein, unlikely [Trypanosoma brucei brucei TREU927]